MFTVLSVIGQLSGELRGDAAPQYAQELLPDAIDETSTYFYVECCGGIAGSARATVASSLALFPEYARLERVCANCLFPVGVLSRLAIASDHRGLGLARLLDDARFDHCKKLGTKSLLVSVTSGRHRGLLSKGFEVVQTCAGEVFPHILRDVMYSVIRL